MSSAMHRRTPTSWVYSLALMLVGICLGLLLQVKVESPTGAAMSQEYEDAQVQAAIQRLEGEQLELKEAIGSLRMSLERLQRLAVSQTETLTELRQELAVQRTRAGLVALEGPGVAVTLDDSSVAPVPTNVDLNPYIVHEYDLRDVINLLWLAGAEAIAVNGERLVADTSVYCVGSTIMVNDTRLSPPYVVRALGDPAMLYAVATDPAYLGDLRDRAQRYGLRLTAKWHKEMMLPAYKGGFAFEYARAGGP